MNEEVNNLSFWFPLIEQAQVPVPRTIIIEHPHDLMSVLDGVEPEGGVFDALVEKIEKAAREIYPAKGTDHAFFLRTGYLSGKHDWKDTCFVSTIDPDVIGYHIVALIEQSAMAGIMGLPYDTWVVRELLDTAPLFHCEWYGGFPVTREFRVFIRDGEVDAIYPYWGLPRVRMAGVVEPPEFVHDLFSASENVVGGSLVASETSATVTSSGDLWGTHGPLVPLDALRHLDKKLGLPSLDPQVWEQRARCIGRLSASDRPKDEGLTVLRSGPVGVRFAAEQGNENRDTSVLHLLDLDLWSEERAVDPSAEVDAERSVCVKQPGGVSEERDIWLYEVESTRRGRVVLALWETDCAVLQGRPDHSRWRDILRDVSALSKTEALELQMHAQAANGAVGGGFWSVDLLQDRLGKWWVTDMADGDRSYRPGVE